MTDSRLKKENWRVVARGKQPIDKRNSFFGRPDARKRGGKTAIKKNERVSGGEAMKGTGKRSTMVWAVVEGRHGGAKIGTRVPKAVNTRSVEGGGFRRERDILGSGK